MFVVHLTDRTSWGRLHLPTGDFGSFSSAYLVQLQYYSSLTSWSVWSCFGKGLSWFLGESGFLQGFVALQYVAFIFQALHHMEPQREGSDGVGPIRLGCISSPFRAHGKEGLDRGLLPVSDDCWMVSQDSRYACPECNQFGVSRLTTCRPNNAL